MVIGFDAKTSSHLLLDNWPQWRQRIIKYAELEKTNRPRMKDTLKKLENTSVAGAKAEGSCSFMTIFQNLMIKNITIDLVFSLTLIV